MKYIDCGGCGRMYNPDKPNEVSDYNSHDCNEVDE